MKQNAIQISMINNSNNSRSDTSTWDSRKTATATFTVLTAVVSRSRISSGRMKVASLSKRWFIDDGDGNEYVSRTRKEMVRVVRAEGGGQ